MGLDGISVNQLRLNTEVNSINPINVVQNRKIDGLSQGKKVDPDADNHQNQEMEEDDENQNTEDKQSDIEEILKYDLSDSEKYMLKVDSLTNNILIVKKDTNEVLQVFSADILQHLMGNLMQGNGVLVNRKY